ncbi:polysaccharide biosynthesis/export family protein [uncultured Prevotella sp.]|jgi:polysaccharide export outer membrane protein|uniref:polysaccharide biosynthesis/export family protein n=1 Tax=uncultured Prevotella sp. TaxID=159272 RepID=UPI0025E48D97|nr:polysaccharide biosynthesis/export family protein [uncultured Prevotella sp.]
MKRFNRIVLPLIALMLLAACGTQKDVPYFQNAESVDLSKSQYLFDAKIMPKDQLTITVSTTNDEAATPFNLTVPTPYTVNSRSTYSQAMLQTYLVDNAGNINFPILGSIHVGGLTKSQAEKMIQDQIKPFMAEAENPIVTVRMPGYQISVIGEVARPGTFTVSREKISILEALAQAGDLTIYGQRKNVQLIREDSTGQKSIHIFDLTDANIINSPYFYLQQNDVIYVTPNKVKAQNSSVGSMTTLWFSATSILISLTSLLYNILR